MKAVCLAIGVGDAPPLDYLRGAVNGARAIDAWANKQGYSTKLLTDEIKPIELSDVDNALTALLAGGADRLLLYFAGHGLSSGAADDLWLLSRWDQERKGVSVAALRDRLLRYGIGQLILIADACRTLVDANTRDVMGDPVVQRGPFAEKLHQGDLWFAASPARAAWMIPGPTPAESRCIFSGLLTEALSGAHVQAYDGSNPSAGITSFSLANFLEAEVPPLAARYGATLVPAITTSIRPPLNVYVPAGPPAYPPITPTPWPDPSAAPIAGMGAPDGSGRIQPPPGESWSRPAIELGPPIPPYGGRRFAVGFSYAGEERAKVEPIAERLAERLTEERVLYDKFHEAELVRPDLDVYLPRLYRDDTELIVVALSPDYPKKLWCGLEWRWIRQLILSEAQDHIMLLQIGNLGDLSELGILSGYGYLDITHSSPEAIADTILERLERMAQQGIARVPPINLRLQPRGLHARARSAQKGKARQGNLVSFKKPLGAGEDAPSFLAVLVADQAAIAATRSTETQRVSDSMAAFQAESRPTHFETGAGFALSGAVIQQVVLGPAATAQPQGEPGWWRIEPTASFLPSPWWPAGIPLHHPLPLLTQLTDGRWVGAAALPHFVLSFTVDEVGAQAVIYRSMYTPFSPVTEQVMARLRAGALRREQAPELVELLRASKHADPMLGVLAAYLHDSMGDLANVRRTAFFFAEQGHPIPFDIALLGRLEGLRDAEGLVRVLVPPVPEAEGARNIPIFMRSATPSIEGVLAGAFPWLRQGWDRLDPEGRSDLYPPGLAQLTPQVLPAPFTTLTAIGGDDLAHLLFSPP
ncbi:MAG: hypothetical protein VKM17_10305 [Cyanobacteriota bacterium]|nr:hypothetical protein [Cyanobacteriota bacterium]